MQAAYKKALEETVFLQGLLSPDSILRAPCAMLKSRMDADTENNHPYRAQTLSLQLMFHLK